MPGIFIAYISSLEESVRSRTDESCVEINFRAIIGLPAAAVTVFVIYLITLDRRKAPSNLRAVGVLVRLAWPGDTKGVCDSADFLSRYCSVLPLVPLLGVSFASAPVCKRLV